MSSGQPGSDRARRWRRDSQLDVLVGDARVNHLSGRGATTGCSAARGTTSFAATLAATFPTADADATSAEPKGRCAARKYDGPPEPSARRHRRGAIDAALRSRSLDPQSLGWGSG